MSQFQTNFTADSFPSAEGYVAPDAPEEQAAPAPEPEDSGSEEVPTGTINEVKAWVGDDKERAQAALDAENAKETPRSTLVDWLEGVLEEE